MQKLRIYNWSDLHIDNIAYSRLQSILYNEFVKDCQTINILTLTGDIASPYYKYFKQFFETVSKIFDHVIYIQEIKISPCLW